MNIDTATRDQILSEILCNEENYPGLDYDSICGLGDEQLRACVKKWILESPEA